jgi:hypothetical protein
MVVEDGSENPVGFGAQNMQEPAYEPAASPPNPNAQRVLYIKGNYLVPTIDI